jgi:hypothetical protein
VELDKQKMSFYVIILERSNLKPETFKNSTPRAI